MLVGFEVCYQKYWIYHQRKVYFLKLIGLYSRKTVPSFSRDCFICSVVPFSNSKQKQCWVGHIRLFLLSNVNRWGFFLPLSYRELRIWGMICLSESICFFRFYELFLFKMLLEINWRNQKNSLDELPLNSHWPLLELNLWSLKLLKKIKLCFHW